MNKDKKIKELEKKLIYWRFLAITIMTITILLIWIIFSTTAFYEQQLSECQENYTYNLHSCLDKLKDEFGEVNLYDERRGDRYYLYVEECNKEIKGNSPNQVEYTLNIHLKQKHNKK